MIERETYINNQNKFEDWFCGLSHYELSYDCHLIDRGDKKYISFYVNTWNTVHLNLSDDLYAQLSKVWPVSTRGNYRKLTPVQVLKKIDPKRFETVKKIQIEAEAKRSRERNEKRARAEADKKAEQDRVFKANHAALVSFAERHGLTEYIKVDENRIVIEWDNDNEIIIESEAKEATQ